MAAQHLGDHCRQPVTGAGGVEAIELGRMAEQEEAGVEEALQLGVARRQPPDLLGPLLHRQPHRLGTGVTLQPEEAGQGRHHGAHTSCSPYGAQAVRTTIASASSASTISSANRVFPAPGSPMIDTTPL